MGNASKAQVTKQLDFTIPVDYVGGGGGISQVSIIFLWKCLFLFWAQKIWN